MQWSRFLGTIFVNSFSIRIRKIKRMRPKCAALSHMIPCRIRKNPCRCLCHRRGMRILHHHYQRTWTNCEKGWLNRRIEQTSPWDRRGRYTWPPPPPLAKAPSFRPSSPNLSLTFFPITLHTPRLFPWIFPQLLFPRLLFLSRWYHKANFLYAFFISSSLAPLAMPSIL